MTLAGTAPRTGGGQNPRFMVHNRLTEPDAQGAPQPQLATEKPSVAAGTWRIDADGGMETTWKIRPNVKWHDGTPFTSADLLFTLELRKDPDLCCSSGRPDLIQSASAPDPYTLVVRWSGTFVDADQGQEFEPAPRHILEETYRTRKDTLINTPWLTTEFIGLGPYRLARWEQGSHMELARFDDYFLGRPPLDTVFVRFIDDPNALIAGVLSGSLDGILPPGIDVDAAVEVRRRWEGTPNQVRFNVGDNFENVQIQFRPDYARPLNGLTSLPVRQALYQSIDRRALTEVATQGVAPVADSWISPVEALRSQVEAAVPQFPYDPARAQQLLADAGWTRGADAALRNSQTGDRLEIELRANQGGGSEREQNVIADSWKAVGAPVGLVVIPVARQADNEYQNTFPGAYLFFSGAPAYYSYRLHTKEIATAANRWQGRNRGGYSSPRVDGLLDALVVTIDPGERLKLHRELLQEQMGDIPVMPLYWFVDPLLLTGDVRVPPVPKGEVAANFFLWDKA
jgi:peptide/nickel transport system substrate-binding protein